MKVTVKSEWSAETLKFRTNLSIPLKNRDFIIYWFDYYAKEINKDFTHFSNSLQAGPELLIGNGSRMMRIAVFAAWHSSPAVPIVSIKVLSPFWANPATHPGSHFVGSLPGDDCPLVWGNCKHVFHIHCIVKWLNSQMNQQLCPMCRQPWKFNDK